MKLHTRMLTYGVMLGSLFFAGNASATMAGTTFNTDFSNFTIDGAFNGPIGPGPLIEPTAPTLAGGTSLLGGDVIPGSQALSDFVLAAQPGLSAGDPLSFSVAGAPVTFSGATAGGAITDGVGPGIAGAGGPGVFTQPQASLYLSSNTALIVGGGDTLTIDFTEAVVAASFTALNVLGGAQVDFEGNSFQIGGLFTPAVFLSLTDSVDGVIESIQLTNLGDSLISIDNFSFTTAAAPVPLPAAAWLFLSAFGSFFAFARKKKNTVIA